jgi:hypothetical protein
MSDRISNGGFCCPGFYNSGDQRCEEQYRRTAGEVCVEIPDLMGAQFLAMAPDQEGRSVASARLAILQSDASQGPEEMSMSAYLPMTPSFEPTAPDTPYRFVVMPRRIVPVAPDGSVAPDGQYRAVGKTSTTTIWHF